MSADNFNSLIKHAGHSCIVQTYEDKNGEVLNASIECIDCNSVLISYDKYDPNEEFVVLSVTRADIDEWGNIPEGASSKSLQGIVDDASSEEDFSDNFLENLEKAIKDWYGQENPEPETD